MTMAHRLDAVLYQAIACRCSLPLVISLPRVSRVPAFREFLGARFEASYNNVSRDCSHSHGMHVRRADTDMQTVRTGAKLYGQRWSTGMVVGDVEQWPTRRDEMWCESNGHAAVIAICPFQKVSQTYGYKTQASHVP